MASYSFIVNGQPKNIEADGNTVLLHALRDQLNLNSPKYGCGTGICGACRILVDGEICNACTRTLAESDNAVIMTVEGLSEDGLLHPLQSAFLELNAAQCGYCLSGILITACKLLETNPHPDRLEIQAALKDNLCRCGAHNRIIKAIETASATTDG